MVDTVTFEVTKDRVRQLNALSFRMTKEKDHLKWSVGSVKKPPTIQNGQYRDLCNDKSVARWFNALSFKMTKRKYHLKWSVGSVKKPLTIQNGRYRARCNDQRPCKAVECVVIQNDKKKRPFEMVDRA